MTEKVQKAIDKILSDKSAEIKELFMEIREILANHDDRLTEGVKWGMPSYDCKTIVAGLGGFKNHVSIWFHKGAIMKDELGLFVPGESKEMRQIKYEPGDEINVEGIKVYLDEAIELNVAGIKIAKAKSKAEKVFVDSSDFMEQLVKHKEASAFFNGLTTSQQNNFTSYIEEAKQEATKQKRIARSIERLSKGFKTTY
ncbi:YdeI/OmpD-associated family protein [Parvicella tangerina]|uniref:YdhG-like domain-containing protein n=1 Tax=Parvicella tangerina TaxID=2829795 RepID=A0A916JJ86_9FLAO|nr:DUF1801 domain-containing protein [Parvicella tangerina]CAG5076997.1 hypothetical protein CRYO30217_00266 [Parvicella tangerina]